MARWFLLPTLLPVGDRNTVLHRTLCFLDAHEEIQLALAIGDQVLVGQDQAAWFEITICLITSPASAPLVDPLHQSFFVPFLLLS
jgi:hypothetical protein